MRIYYQYSHLKTLSPVKGDQVNEIGHCIALSRFAEVYYSGQRFRPELPDYGLKEYEGEIKVVPADWSIIRANKEVFKRCHGKRVWLSSPFDREMFAQADWIGTFTGVWSEYLREGRNLGPLNPEGERWPHAVPFYQTLLPWFRPPAYTHSVTEILKQEIGTPFIIGVFGRMVKSTYPSILLKILDQLGDFCTVLVGTTPGKNTIPLPRHRRLVVRSFSNGMMPFVYSACDAVVVSQWGPEWEFCGNLKTLEPMACGVPVICQRSPARIEMLGPSYPFFVDDMANGDPKILLGVIRDALQKGSLYAQDLVKRSLFYHAEASGERLQKLLSI